jgi:hypothetical protein
MFAGTPLMVGAVRSVTITLNVALAVVPALSVAVQVTVVAAILNVAPEAGEQLEDVIVL